MGSSSPFAYYLLRASFTGGQWANEPYITPNGKYLFFSRFPDGKGNIYWVDAGVIEELKPNRLR
ncbi:MAG: hypothetical protein GY940_41675 [bacterium]|nr:hypothetical protein [bacterium]